VVWAPVRYLRTPSARTPQSMCPDIVRGDGFQKRKSTVTTSQEREQQHEQQQNMFS
jgi:hypothetical protein